MAIRLDIKLVWEPIMTPKTKQCNISLAENRDMKVAKNAMDKMLGNLNWDNLTLNEAGEKLQQILIAANVDSYNTAPVQKKETKECI